MYLNKVFIIGNLTRDPELKTIPSGTAVTTFSLATNRVWTDKNGAKQEGTDYHNIVVFGRQAETVAQYLKKGSSALVEGRLTTRRWEGADGVKKYRTEIIADRIQFGPRKFQGTDEAGHSSPPKAAGNGSKEEINTIEYPDEEINPDDIPF